MKVSNMTSSRGNAVPNQFYIVGVPPQESFDGVPMKSGDRFQSYRSVIAHHNFTGELFLDSDKWDYSRTTSKYRNQFTGFTTAQTKAGIKDGSIKLVNLN